MVYRIDECLVNITVISMYIAIVVQMLFENVCNPKMSKHKMSNCIMSNNTIELSQVHVQCVLLTRYVQFSLLMQ